MNTQPRAPQEDPPPSKWNTRWYRFRLRLYRLAARLLRMPRPHDVNTACKNEYWRGFYDAKKHYLDHCPVHPEELMLPTGWGYRKCCVCWNKKYFESLDFGPITDQHRGTHIPTGTRLFEHLDRTRKLVGPETQEHRATWRSEKRE